MYLVAVVLTFSGFLSGAVMYSYLIPKFIKKVDPREYAYDKNPGGSNAMSTCGIEIGIICILLDVAKAFIPVYIAINTFNISGMSLVPPAAAPVLGHAFSPFLKFRGGKAVASAYGVLLALYPQSIVAFILALIMLFYKIVVVIKPDSSSSVASFLTVNLMMLLIESQLYIRLIVLIIALIVIGKQLLHPDKGDTSICLFNRYTRIAFKRHKDR